MNTAQLQMGTYDYMTSKVQKKEFPRCVVLTPESHLETAQSVIEKHGLNAIIMHEPALAMAELALMYQEMNSTRPWKDKPTSLQLVLIHANVMSQADSMIQSTKKYFHNIQLFELREGTIAPMRNTDEIVDNLVDPPMIQSENIDADELSMLLDGQHNEAEE